jgi:hypothetical protein
MESRPKTEDYKLSLDAMRGRAAMPYNAFGVDSIPSPSVLDKQKDELQFVFLFGWSECNENRTAIKTSLGLPARRIFRMRF